MCQYICDDLISKYWIYISIDLTLLSAEGTTLNQWWIQTWRRLLVLLVSEYRRFFIILSGRKVQNEFNSRCLKRLFCQRIKKLILILEKHFWISKISAGRWQKIIFNPYWQISETKSKNWVRHQPSFLETKSRQTSWVTGHKLDFLGYV